MWSCCWLFAKWRRRCRDYFHVREVLFRPHTSYSRYSTESKFQQVSFIERVEIGNEETKALNVKDVLIHPFEVDGEKPSTSGIIRVAAFASEKMIIHQSRVLDHFQRAIQNDATLDVKFSDPNNDQMSVLPVSVCGIREYLEDFSVDEFELNTTRAEEDSVPEIDLNLL